MARRREFDEAEVVEKAMHAFWSHGYRSTTPQMLVDATGLSKSSLYATFDNKKGLFLKSLDRYSADQAAFMASMLDSMPLRQGLEALYTELIAS
ncbi:MAG: helix-turn-helix transcriptional regulator, partial [Deltaproteobacteria bacterium]|nr:helix-turn-helix transcriptional regulator [Deltaproteobacteria bacterium]